MAQRAVDETKALLAEAPEGGEIKGGKAVPPEWSVRYRPTLGSFKSFVQQYPADFEYAEQEPGRFIVSLVPGAEPISEEALESAKARMEEARANAPVPAPVGLVPGSEDKAPWAVSLREAFELYASLVPDAKMDIDEFLGPLPPAGQRRPRAQHDSAVPARSRAQHDSTVPAAFQRPGFQRPAALVATPIAAVQAQARAHTQTVAAKVAEEERALQPEFARILQAKFGLKPGAVLRVVGQGKSTGKPQWKLEDGHCVPLDQEGVLWHRVTAAQADALALVDSMPAVYAPAAEGAAAENPPEEPPTPSPPWVVAEHPDEPGSYYFFNEETGESVWELPETQPRHQRGCRGRKRPLQQ